MFWKKDGLCDAKPAETQSWPRLALRFLSGGGALERQTEGASPIHHFTRVDLDLGKGRERGIRFCEIKQKVDREPGGRAAGRPDDGVRCGMRKTCNETRERGNFLSTSHASGYSAGAQHRVCQWAEWYCYCVVPASQQQLARCLGTNTKGVACWLLHTVPVRS